MIWDSRHDHPHPPAQVTRPDGGGVMKPIVQSFAMPDVVESVVRSKTNGALMAAVAQLWIKPDDVVADVTYGEGLFWTRYRPEHLIAHDKYTLDGVDFCRLPEETASVDVVVFDPPYVSKGGRDTSGIPEMDSRYGLQGAPRTPALLVDLIAKGMTEADRVLRPGGCLLVKTMDYVSSGRMVWGRRSVVTVATDLLGMEQVDEFVHHSGTGPQPKGRRQVHSRRAHSFLVVFEKSAVVRGGSVGA